MPTSTRLDAKYFKRKNIHVCTVFIDWQMSEVANVGRGTRQTNRNSGPKQDLNPIQKLSKNLWAPFLLGIFLTKSLRGCLNPASCHSLAAPSCPPLIAVGLRHRGMLKDKCIFRYVCMCVYASMHAWMDGWMDGWMLLWYGMVWYGMVWYGMYVCMYVCM